MGALVIANSGPARRSIIEPPRPPSPQRKSSDDTAADAAPSSRPAADVVLDSSVEVAKLNMDDGEAAAAWTAALLPLVKGKTSMDEVQVAQTSAVLDEVERADRKRGGFAREVLKVPLICCLLACSLADWIMAVGQGSGLADTVRRLGELESVPFGDLHRLRARARTLADWWRDAFGDEVVDLQRGVLLSVSK